MDEMEAIQWKILNFLKHESMTAWLSSVLCLISPPLSLAVAHMVILG